MSATPNAKNADGEASNKNANLQSEYAGNLAKIKTLKRRMDAWDMISLFVIPDFIDPYALSVEDRWGDRKLTGVNLLKNWGKVTLKQPMPKLATRLHRLCMHRRPHKHGVG